MEPAPSYTSPPTTPSNLVMYPQGLLSAVRSEQAGSISGSLDMERLVIPSQPVIGRKGRTSIP
jgi:hypothetical protein